MTPLGLAGVWIATGVLGTSAARAARRARLAALAPLLAGALGALTVVSVTAGPFSSVRFGGDLEIGRPELGFLVALGPALALTLILAPRVEGGEVLAACVAGAAGVVALGSTLPVIWGLALAVGVGAVALRWISVLPTRATLSMGRVAGLGAAALLAAAVLLPVQAPPSDVRAAMAGALLAAGISLVVGLTPVGGWTAGAGLSLRGTEFAAWSMVLAPAALLSARVAVAWLGGRSADAFAETILVLGLVSAIYSGVHALVARPSERYCRVLFADLGLAAAGLGTRRVEGELAVLVLVLIHLAVGPLLLNPARPGFERPRRLAWIALSGLPPSLGFWGRLLVLQAFDATSGTGVLVCLAAAVAIAGASLRAIADAAAVEDERLPPGTVRALAWAVGIAGLGAGLAPGCVTGHVFGVDLGAASP